MKNLHEAALETFRNNTRNKALDAMAQGDYECPEIEAMGSLADNFFNSIYTPAQPQKDSMLDDIDMYKAIVEDR